MKIKLCFKEEIHRIANVPTTLEALIKQIPTIFHSQLPGKWALQYKDSDGDNILITDEKDFEEFKITEHGGAAAIAKIYVVSIDSFKAPQPVSDTSMIMSNLKKEEDYQVIEDEENKPEEVIKIKEEVSEALPVKEPEVAPEVMEIPKKEEITEKPEEIDRPTEGEEPEKKEEKVSEEVKPTEGEEEVERKEDVGDIDLEVSEKDLSERCEKEEEPEAQEEEEEPKVQEIVNYPGMTEVPNEIKEVPEPKIKELVEEKPVPVINREEEKQEKEEPCVELPKAEPVKIEKVNDLSKLLDGKISMDVLQTLVASMIDKKLPEIAQYTQSHIEEQRSSLNQSMFDQSILLNDDFPKKPAAPKVIHYEIRCVACGMSPIVGNRYKCTICHNFDYCEQCEEAGTHPHNFIKIRQRDVLDIFKPPSKPVVAPVKPVEWKKPALEIFPRKPEVDQKDKGEQDPKFYDNLIEKAKKLQKCFPQEDFVMLCVFLTDAPADLTIEELVENYKYGKK